MPSRDMPKSPVTAVNGDQQAKSDYLGRSPGDSGSTSPTLDGSEGTPEQQKKKKKKKPKKSAKAKEGGAQHSATNGATPDGPKPTVLCISRNKHWRYISSYHGPWLQLPIELLESLLALNLDPTTLTAPEPPRMNTILNSQTHKTNSPRRERGFHGLGDHSSPSDLSPRATYTSLSLPPPMPNPKPGKATPPPIDPGVFRSVSSIRRLIDEASELSVRASSGLSAVELGSLRNGSGILGGSPWATAQTLGINPMGNMGGNGRSVAMSAMRIHRLRALAVQKLAQAYKADEIASSVMVMQGGSVFDDLAERVLKVEPNDVDAKYVHFFHEKIPSRQLAESTTTQVLDQLIRQQPQRLEYYRTRGIVQCFRDEYPQAIKDFTHALKESRALRKMKHSHVDRGGQSESRTKGKKKKGRSGHSNGQAPPNGTSVAPESVDGLDGEPVLLHPSVLPDAPDPIEPQLLFLRGAAYLQHAVFLIENAILQLEDITKEPSLDGAELRLCYIENGRYGGVEIGNMDGPLGKNDEAKVKAYRHVLASPDFRDQISNLLRRCIKDHERFLAHFDSLSSPIGFHTDGDIAARVEYAFLLSESIRPGNHGNIPPPPLSHNSPPMFTTYHPLLVESHFSILIAQLMQADFTQILPTFVNTAAVVDGLEGYPVFLPPRSMAQAEFIEVLERLAAGWKVGIQPHSLTRTRSKHKLLAIEPAPPTPTPQISSILGIGSSSSSSQIHEGADGGEGSSSHISSKRTSRKNSDSSTHTWTSNTAATPRADVIEALDSARILLAPVVNRQREKAGKVAADKAAGVKKKPLPINIPLHGPRVEIVLAWLGAVHLPEMDV